MDGNEWTCGLLVDGKKDKWMDGQLNRRWVDTGWMGGRMDEWIDGQIDGWMIDGWMMDGWIDDGWMIDGGQMGR